MREEHAPGLGVDWLNGWMAAIGVCALVPDLRLRWADGPVPTACFLVPDDAPLPELVARSLPSEEQLGSLAIARRLDGRPELPRTVTLAAYADRAVVERQTRDASLSSTLTDLVDEKQADDLPHSPFDPAVPRGITLWERVMSCRQAIEDPVKDLAATFAGKGRRVAANGLGFDARRLLAGVQEADKRVDPVVELLAFLAMPLFPMRGNGKQDDQARARGWQGPARQTGSFRWCAWSPYLDRWGIDALVDLLPGARQDPAAAKRLGVTAWYHSVPYRWMSPSDTTRAYGAEAEP